MFTSAMAHVIVQLHVLTGCDHNCGFYGHGKKAVIKKVMKSSEARVLLHECSDTLPIPAHVLKNLNTFVIKYIYGSKELGCAETQATEREKMKKKSMQRLMPDEDTLSHICLCANYLAYCQKNFHLSHQPSPIGNGWEIIDGKCHPVRNVLPALPASLLSQSAQSDEDSSDSDDIDDCSETDSTESENDD